MDKKNFEVRSEEIEEILSYIPHWIIRWGITLIIGIIFIILLGSWIIKYPEIIKSRIIITTETPPATVIARASGKLAMLFVKENEFVEANTYLAAIENPVNILDALKLKEEFERFKVNWIDPESGINFNFNEDAHLGELQIVYSDFSQSYKDYKSFVNLNYYPNRIKSNEVQLSLYEDSNKNLTQQKIILNKELELAEKKYNMNKTLFGKGLVSEHDFATAESTYLQKKYSLEQAENNIIANNIKLEELRNSIFELKHQFYERNRVLILSLQDSYNELQSQFDIWEQRYILKAPIDGRVSLFKFWNINQYVNLNEEVMTIVPSSHEIIGKIYLPGKGMGKVKVGQKVKINFDSYPFNEFGAVEGEVGSISLISRDNIYLINIRLTNGLKTTYDKTLEFKQGMQGNVDIITEDLRVLERIFNKIRYIFTSSVFK